MGGSPPQYDPGSDGWKTEQWSADISAQLKKVFSLLLERGDWQTALASACAAALDAPSAQYGDRHAVVMFILGYSTWGGCRSDSVARAAARWPPADPPPATTL